MKDSLPQRRAHVTLAGVTEDADGGCEDGHRHKQTQTRPDSAQGWGFRAGRFSSDVSELKKDRIIFTHLDTSPNEREKCQVSASTSPALSPPCSVSGPVVRVAMATTPGWLTSHSFPLPVAKKVKTRAIWSQMKSNLPQLRDVQRLSLRRT